MKLTRRILSLCLIPLILVGLFLPGPARAQSPASPAADPFSPSARQVLAALAPDGMATFVITLRDQLAAPLPGAAGPALLQAAAGLPSRAARQQAVIEALQAHAASQQAGLLAQAGALQAQGAVRQVIPFWIFNGVSLQATPAAIQALAARPEVASIVPDPDPNNPIVPLEAAAPVSALAQGPTGPAATPPPEPNLTLVNAPALWALGYTGQGIVVANLDTGVNAAHPDLINSYRGGSNSWYDPYGQNPAPFDSLGHGTETMGIMVGGGDPAATSSIGMAPGARWIAAKIFNNINSATLTAVHQAFQWVINPNNDPANTGAPDVVNSSWGNTAPGCDLTFQSDLTALLAAGILPVFSAGNSGPNASSDVSPGNNPGAFPVGAIDNSSAIAGFSSRGPTTCNSAPSFPLLVAPGVQVRTSFNGGGYGLNSGTSFSAPTVSGALALLLSAMPYLTPAQQQQALILGAAPLGAPLPNSTFGYGRLDVLASFNSLNAPLKIPAGLAANPVSSSQMDLSWTDANAGAAVYEVERSPDKKTWTLLTTTLAGAASYSDTAGLTPDTLYYYRVRAVNGPVNSQYAGASAVVPAAVLQAPTALAAAAFSPSQINLSWVNHSALATAIEVDRSPDGLSGWSVLDTALSPTTTTYADASGLSEGTTYYYRVQARAPGLGLSSAYASASATSLLLAPTALSATAASAAQIDLSWTDHSLLASGYEVQRSPNGQNGWVSLATLPDPSAHSYSDSAGLAEGTPYFYQVRAMGSGANSTFASASAFTQLLPPTGLTATAVSPTQVNLSWTNHSTLATQYQIQRSPDGSTWSPLIATSPTATSFNDTIGLAEGTPYYYQVRAVGSSAASAYVGANATTPLQTPILLMAVPASNTQIDLYWANASLLATGVELQRSPDGVSGWTTIFITSTGSLPTFFSDSGLLPGKVYYYQVRSTSLAVDSFYSAPNHAVTGPYRYIFALIHK